MLALQQQGRLHHQTEANLDWMFFWLKGEIPSDPERAARWSILRQQQNEVLKPRRRGICNNEGGRAGQVRRHGRGLSGYYRSTATPDTVAAFRRSLSNDARVAPRLIVSSR